MLHAQTIDERIKQLNTPELMYFKRSFGFDLQQEQEEEAGGLMDNWRVSVIFSGVDWGQGVLLWG